MKKNQLIFILLVLSISLSGQTTIRDSLFNYDWRFHMGGIEGAETFSYDDSNWRLLDLPHDWSIEDLDITDTTGGRIISGPFDSEALAGKHSGFTVGGTGWYRKHFRLSESDTGRLVFIHFDGIYMNADVWLNGNHLGNQPYGYTPFWYELSAYLNYGDTENILAVEVKNEGVNSRWYSGSGIYRNVKLSIVNRIHVKPWGIFVSVEEADSLMAKISVEVNLANHMDEGREVDILFDIVDSESETVADKSITTYIHQQLVSQTIVNFALSNPELWSPDSPAMYKMVCTVQADDKIIDRYETGFGIRTIAFDAEKGMFINGKNIKLKGSCLHANNGPFGACAYCRVEERRVELMKSLGFNAIRCAHNPPSEVFLDACDRLGILVIDEAFDVWSLGWLPDDYHNYYDEWWEHDIRNMVMRDRNHPSVFAWSIRNQVREAKDSAAIATARIMKDFIRTVDPTRPVTANVAMFEDHFDGDPELWKLRDPFFEVMDICGYSYQSSQFVDAHKRLPDRIQFSSEIDPRNAFTNWMRVTDNDYVIGNFTWTGMDMMGEVSLGWMKGFGMPHAELFPWTNSYSGDIDICGFRRPRSYYRDILFGRENQLSLFVRSPVPSFANDRNSPWGWEDVKPSWTWPGYEGDTLEIVAYSACDSVRLELNGKTIGTKFTNRVSEFKAYWSVPYQPGELKAIGFLHGKEVHTSALQTTDEPYQIRLTADRSKIRADKQDLCFITVELMDKQGSLVPYAANLIEFDITGEGILAAVGNGNPVSLESFQQTYRKAYEGKCLLVIKSTEKAGEIHVAAKSKGLHKDSLVINTFN